MNRIIAVVTLALIVAPAVAEDRFAPDNPWFAEFEETCRDRFAMNEECQGSVLGAFAEFSGSADVTCDFAEFWRVRDTVLSGDVIAALPWQNGVEAIVREPGVCHPST